MNLLWYGDKFRRDVEAETKRRMVRAAIVVNRSAKMLLSVSGTGMRRGGVIVPAFRTGRGRVYGAFPSLPGEPPHKQTGRLRSSVTYEITEGWTLFGGGNIISAPTRAWVGTNVKYGRYLELGTKRIEPRPWLKRSLDESIGEIKRIFEAPMRI